MVAGLARRLCLFLVIARRGVREPPLFLVTVARASPTFSRRTAYFYLAGNLDHELKRCFFGVVRLRFDDFALFR